MLVVKLISNKTFRKRKPSNKRDGVEWLAILMYSIIMSADEVYLCWAQAQLW